MITPDLNLSRSIVVYANTEPRNGAASCGPQHLYRFARTVIESRTLAPLPGSWIRVRMAWVGICGTDLHLLEAGDDGYTRCSSPSDIPPGGRILGHEGVGYVHAIGDGVDHFKPGDLVCFESIMTCHSCEKCRQGCFNQCERSRLVGMEEDGLFTEYADMPAALAHGVHDMAKTHRDLEGLACVEPAAVAYLACANARISPGEKVAVFGAGPIGFFAALMAKTIFGASRVGLTEPLTFRREFAQRASDQAYHPDEFAEDHQSYDVLIDAAGDLADVSAAIPRIKGNGRIVLLARTGQPLHVDMVDQVISKSLSLIGSRGHLGGAMHAVLSLARSGRLDLHAPITRVVEGLDGLAEVLAKPGLCQAADCKVIAKLTPPR